MRTIVIRPEIIGFDNTGVREPRRRWNKAGLMCFALIPVVALGAWALGRSSSGPVAPAAPKVSGIAPAKPLPLKRAAVAPQEGAIDLQAALEEKLITADFTGNGREQFQATLFNQQAKPLVVKVSFGQMFESGPNLVVATRSVEVEIPAGQCSTFAVATAATRSTNHLTGATYRLSPRTTPKIDQLLSYAQDHPELTAGALQTAILALTDNLPLSSVCKFTPAGADLPSRFDTTAFRAETADVLSALTVLREIGVRDRELALTVDPQLKLEAMIEPLLRATAMRYYGIAPENEWAFWKAELLAGESGIRHYALFGIARFYPQIALEMLPKWAREKRTNSSFRIAAVQALADTRKAEAIPILRQLAKELGRNTELGRAALDATQFLNTELARNAATETIAFRGTVATATAEF